MKNWSDKPCVILASGPGLTDAQCYRARVAAAATHSIVVNDTWRRFPDAEVMYAGDFMYYKVHHKKVKVHFHGQLWTQDAAAAARYGINRVKGANRPGLGPEGMIHTGGNSGYQAINLAYLWGAKKIILLGFTMREIDGKKHWHEDHPKPLVAQILPDEWRHKMKFLADDLKVKGVDVVNCDPLSALTCFRMSTIEQELP